MGISRRAAWPYWGKEDCFAAHCAADPAIQAEVDFEEFVTDEDEGEVEVPFEFAFAAQESVEEIAWVVVDIVLDVVDFVENQYWPCWIVFEGGPDSFEDSVEALVGFDLFAGELAVELGGDREQQLP